MDVEYLMVHVQTPNEFLINYLAQSCCSDAVVLQQDAIWLLFRSLLLHRRLSVYLSYQVIKDLIYTQKRLIRELALCTWYKSTFILLWIKCGELSLTSLTLIFDLAEDSRKAQLLHWRARFWPCSFPTTLSSSKSHLFPTKVIGT